MRLQVFVLFVPSVLFAAELDETLVTLPLSIRSEVTRGLTLAPEPVWVPPQFYSEAKTAIAKTYPKSATTDAFEFGLNYGAWHKLWSALKQGLYKSERQREEAIAEANLDYIIAGTFRKALGLTDADIKSLAPSYYIEAEETLFPELVKTGVFRKSDRPRSTPAIVVKPY